MLRKPVEAAPDRIRGLLLAGRNRHDCGDRSVIEDLGFRVGMWNGSSSRDSVGLSVGCGAYSSVKGLGNALVMNLPSPDGEVGRTYFAGPLAHRLEAPLDGYHTKQLRGGLLVILGEDPTAVSADDVLGLREALGDVVRR